MPIYPFQCDSCGAEFEISRKLSAMRDPAECPACGKEARRLFTGLTVTGKAQDPSTAPKSRPPTGGYAHFGHSHGAGTAGHSHGMWDNTPAPKTPPARQEKSSN